MIRYMGYLVYLYPYISLTMRANIINLPFHKNEKRTFTDELKSFTNVPVVIENEANLSALYEKVYILIQT